VSNCRLAAVPSVRRSLVAVVRGALARSNDRIAVMSQMRIDAARFNSRYAVRDYIRRARICLNNDVRSNILLLASRPDDTRA